MFCILDEAKNKHYQNQKNGNYGDDWEVYDEDNEFGLCEFLSLDILHSKALTLLPNDSLTILLEVAILIPDKSAPVSVDGDGKMVQTGPENLLKDLEIAFSNREFTDVQIQCGDKVFDCHQFMLSARSPVFRAMFQADMTEKKTRKVDVKDLHPDVVAEMLTFIYTGNTPNLNRLAGELLAAAEQYQLELLKNICEERLCNSLEIGNSVSHLVLGDMYQVKRIFYMILSCKCT